MTKIDRYKEVLVTIKKWEGICYWCGEIFRKVTNFRGTTQIWVEHKNVMHETKIFCCKRHKMEWIAYKQTFGELMP